MPTQERRNSVSLFLWTKSMLCDIMKKTYGGIGYGEY